MFELFRLKKTPAVLLCLEPNVTVPKVPQGSQDVQKRKRFLTGPHHRVIIFSAMVGDLRRLQKAGGTALAEPITQPIADS